ncbi:hypothetical protein ACLI4Z_18955 [Natrialbaceae archaeon A-arb3/5]
MTSDRDRFPSRGDELSALPADLSRRRALQLGIAATCLPLAGCVSDEPGDSDSTDDEPDSSNEDTDGSDDDSGDDEEIDDEGEPVDDETRAALIEVVDTYLTAAANSDLETMSEVSHSLNPYDPLAWEEEGWEFQGGDGNEELGEYDVDVIEADGSIDDLLELEGAEFWFDQDDTRDELADERIALLDVGVEGDGGSETDRWALATEDDEWRYLFFAPVDETPADPEEAFSDPIEDEDNDVVEEIIWEHDSPTSDVTQAQVVLTDERGIDAERIRIESTIAGGETGAYDRDDEEFTATWTDITLYVQFDPDGDEITVTAIDGDEETVVHREHYEP